MSVIDEVRERTDIVDLVSVYVPLKKAGRNFKALCPFHKEKTPSFVVFPESQRWQCFGACASGGDIFTFVMKMENMEFSEALRFLARRAGISLAPRSEAQVEGDKRKRLLAEINAAAALYFHHLLRESPEGQSTREYLAQREIEPSSMEAFQLGYSLDEWQALGGYLASKGYQEADIFTAGLSVEREGGGYYDRFRGRLIFPIRDMGGQVIGFGARALDASEPKYLNSPETPLFTKGSVLYGIDLAKGAIRESSQVVIVEGYTDVIMAHQKGFKNVVASMGTALTESQVRALKGLAKRFVLALDADKAGDAATQRGLEVAKEVLRDSVVPVPLGRNLISYEARLGADIRIAILPQGRDPDRVLREEAGLWPQIVEGALPVIDYYFSSVASRLDLNSAKGKSQAVRALLPIIDELGNEVEKGHYLQRLAHLVKIDERKLRAEVAPRKFLVERRKGGPLSSLPGFTFGAEKRLLLLLFEEPERMATIIDEVLASLGTAPLSPEEFEELENREIFSALRKGWEEGAFEEGWEADRFEALLDQALMEHFHHLLELKSQMVALPEKEGGREAILCALRLREGRLRREVEALRFLEEDAEEGEEEALLDLLETIGERTAELGRIQKAKHERTPWRRASREGLWESAWLVEG